MTTPGITPNPEPKSAAFCQSLLLPTQLTSMLGSPDSFADDTDISSALINIRGKAKSSAEKLALITKDETVTSPVRNQNAFNVATDLTNTAEATQRLLESRAKEYAASANSMVEERFIPDEKRLFLYDRISAWVAKQAENGDGGYGKISEAITTNSDFAMVMYNFPHQLLELPFDQFAKFRMKVVEHWVPQATRAIERSHKLGELAARYPAFSQKVHAAFYFGPELAKMRTRFNG